MQGPGCRSNSRIRPIRPIRSIRARQPADIGNSPPRRGRKTRVSSSFVFFVAEFLRQPELLHLAVHRAPCDLEAPCRPGDVPLALVEGRFDRLLEGQVERRGRVRGFRRGSAFSPGCGPFWMVLPWDSSRARSMLFSSSRTLPGQWYPIRVSSASFEILVSGSPSHGRAFS